VVGKTIQDMGMEHRYGQMEQSMKVNGRMIKHMVKESSGILMVIYLKENGSLTRLMAMEFILIRMEQSMKESGKMTFNMVME
jgi:hypothetical protein